MKETHKFKITDTTTPNDMDPFFMTYGPETRVFIFY